MYPVLRKDLLHYPLKVIDIYGLGYKAIKALSHEHFLGTAKGVGC